MLDENRTDGTLRNVGGKIKDAVGGLTGDSSAQAEGKANQAAGQVQDLYGRLADEVRTFSADQPIVALLSAMGVGVVLGVLLGSGRR